MLRRSLAVTLAFLAAGLAAGPGPARADAAGPAFVVTYIEATPGSAERAAQLIRDYAAAARREPGNREALALRRLERPYHFALVETWTDAEARAAHAAGPGATALRAALGPLLGAPYDERNHVPLSVGPAGPPGRGAVLALTHVDVIPTGKEQGVALVGQAAQAFRATPGAIRADALTQESRTNHMTLVEAWTDAPAKEAQLASPAARTLRDGLAPLSGSLYDERLYAVLEDQPG